MILPQLLLELSIVAPLLLMVYIVLKTEKVKSSVKELKNILSSLKKKL